MVSAPPTFWIPSFRVDGEEPSGLALTRTVQGAHIRVFRSPACREGHSISLLTFPPTVFCVVPAESCFSPPTSAEQSAKPSVLLTPQHLAESSQGVEQGAVWLLDPICGMQALNMSVFTDVNLVDGHNGTDYIAPPAIKATAGGYPNFHYRVLATRARVTLYLSLTKQVRR